MEVFDYYVYEEGLETIEVEVLPVSCFQLYQERQRCQNFRPAWASCKRNAIET
jgi:hypothetical protein